MTVQTTSSGSQRASSARRPKNGHYTQFRRNGNEVYSALDLGTNNCRLLVAKPTRDSFHVVDAFSRIVRLGEGVSLSGQLSAEAVDRTIEALKVCAEKMQRRGVTHMRNVATEACRAAANCDDFVARVLKETGITLDIISPAEEARLAVLGCQALLDKETERAIVFDIGGGSTELIWLAIEKAGPPRILGWTSMPIGVVNLSEAFPSNGEVDVALYESMISKVLGWLEPFEAQHNMSAFIKSGQVQMLGTSGTVTTLTSLHLDLPRYDRSQVDGAWIDAREMQSLCRSLANMNYTARSAHQCIGSDRAELIVAGCAILDAIIGLWPAPRIRVADRGIREGMLLDLIEGGRNRQAGRYRSRRKPSSIQASGNQASGNQASGNQASGTPASGTPASGND
jgi:exopolyphosphatase/guanosine-5'-triphosphate,3'-diphosphate pyrophosphatase